MDTSYVILRKNIRLHFSEIFLLLEEKVNNEGDDFMKQIISIVKDYHKALNNMFYERDIDSDLLVDDFKLFIDQIKNLDPDIFSGVEGKMNLLEISGIVVDTWQLIIGDDKKVVFTGKSLVGKHPFFTKKTERSFEEIFSDLKGLQSFSESFK